MKYLFLILIIVVVYLTFVSPYIHNFKKVTNDTNLIEKLTILDTCKQFDMNSHNKGISHFKNFMMRYSNSFASNNINTLESLNIILDNYLTEAANRKNDYYYKMYS